MNYLIFDLEWNNTFGRDVNINEIIEIGAVLLDDSLLEIGRFSTFVRPQIARKLNSRTKNLTHITNQDIQNGIPFPQAVSELTDFMGTEETTALSWGDTDLRVLIENLKCFLHRERIPFLTNYLDLQKYYHTVTERPLNQQASLSSAAESLHIDPEKYALHRALDDSLLSADCFRAIFNAERIMQMIRRCDESFYQRLLFKPYIINDLESPLIDSSKMVCSCDRCGGKMQRVTSWKFFNSAFHAVFFCRTCNRKLNFSIRFKKYYDHLDVRTRAVEYVRKRDKCGEKGLNDPHGQGKADMMNKATNKS